MVSRFWINTRMQTSIVVDGIGSHIVPVTAAITVDLAAAVKNIVIIAVRTMIGRIILLQWMQSVHPCVAVVLRGRRWDAITRHWCWWWFVVQTILWRERLGWLSVSVVVLQHVVSLSI